MIIKQVGYRHSNHCNENDVNNGTHLEITSTLNKWSMECPKWKQTDEISRKTKLNKAIGDVHCNFEQNTLFSLRWAVDCFLSHATYLFLISQLMSWFALVTFYVTQWIKVLIDWLIDPKFGLVQRIWSSILRLSEGNKKNVESSQDYYRF